MKWIEIKKKYPKKFILIENVKEEKISDNEHRILSGNVVRTSKDIKIIMKEYQRHKEKGKNVVFSLPNTPEDFVIEDVPFMGILK